jgi:hypothetical protein
MFDIRKHLVYLIAIFLALTLGILIGMSFYAPGQVSLQTKQLSDLRVRVNGALDESRMTKDQLERVETAVETLRPRLVHGKLAGKGVVVIQTGDYPDATQSAVTAIRDAGGVVLSTVIVNDKMSRLAASTPTAGASTDPPPVADGDPAYDKFDDGPHAINALADAIAQGTTASQANQTALSALESQGLVTVTGDLPLPAAFVVLVGGNKPADGETPGDAASDPNKQVDGPLIDRMRASSHGKVTVVGCEPFTAAISSIPDYQGFGIPTVDCIERPLGRLDLPFALRGGADAVDYGLKPTASRKIPVSLEETPS